MRSCKHLDYDESKYGPDIKLRELGGFPCRVRFWDRGPTWTDGPMNEGNPQKVQFCKKRGRINGIFQCYNKGEMPCYEPEESDHG